MEDVFPTSNFKEDVKEIIRFYIKYSLIILLVSICLVSFLSFQENSWNNLIQQLLIAFGLIQVVCGIVVFLIYSSYSSGFDAIWTPQMQGEIQRDERERQITGWTKAASGASLLVSGILVLIGYVSLFKM